MVYIYIGFTVSIGRLSHQDIYRANRFFFDFAPKKFSRLRSRTACIYALTSRLSNVIGWYLSTLRQENYGVIPVVHFDFLSWPWTLTFCPCSWALNVLSITEYKHPLPSLLSCFLAYHVTNKLWKAENFHCDSVLFKYQLFLVQRLPIAIISAYYLLEFQPLFRWQLPIITFLPLFFSHLATQGDWFQYNLLYLLTVLSFERTVGNWNL